MREYHYVVTLRWTGPNHQTMTASYADTISVAPGSKRYDTYIRVFDKAKHALDVPDRCAIVFFSLEPNELAA